MSLSPVATNKKKTIFGVMSDKEKELAGQLGGLPHRCSGDAAID